MFDKEEDRIKIETKFYEKSLGLTPADLLIIEIKKPNRPIIPKKNSILGKNYRKNNKTILYNNNYDDPNFKDPKVRILLYNYKFNRKYVHY